MSAACRALRVESVCFLRVSVQIALRICRRTKSAYARFAVRYAEQVFVFLHRIFTSSTSSLRRSALCLRMLLASVASGCSLPRSRSVEPDLFCRLDRFVETGSAGPGFWRKHSFRAVRRQKASRERSRSWRSPGNIDSRSLCPLDLVIFVSLCYRGFNRASVSSYRPMALISHCLSASRSCRVARSFAKRLISLRAARFVDCMLV
jgi:hypothetical protein